MFADCLSRVVRGWGLTLLAAVAGLLAAVEAAADRGELARAAGERLVAAYPEHLERVDGPDLIWSDGTRMPLGAIDEGKPFAAWLERPDPAEMLKLSYPAGAPAVPPARDYDPGRARNAAFFARMYGPCMAPGHPGSRLKAITWLPLKAGQTLWVTTVNGVDRRLAAVSAELDRLGPEFDAYLVPSAGTVNCRTIAGTTRPSAHGYGIAIDIAIRHSDYWRWVKPDASGDYPFRNRIPARIVGIFEQHGFIWGGRWYHYDTMHFEYRPELLPPLAPLPPLP